MVEGRIRKGTARARRGSRQNAELATLAGILGGLIASLVRRGALSRAEVDALLARERRDLLPLLEPHAGRMVDVIEFLTRIALAGREDDGSLDSLPPAPAALAARMHERSRS